MGVGRLTRVSASDTHPPQRDEDVQALPRVLPSQEVEVRRVAAEPGREPPPPQHTHALHLLLRSRARTCGGVAQAARAPLCGLPWPWSGPGPAPSLRHQTGFSRPPAGVDTMASYEEVLHLLRYRNWHSRSLLDRKFKLVCSELNGRYVSNEFQVEVSAGLPWRKALCTALMFANSSF